MQAVIFAVLAGLCWGVGEVFTRSVLHSKQVGPITAIAVRSSVALPVLWGVWAWLVASRGMEPVRFWQADAGVLWKLVLGSGLVAGAGGMLFFYVALSFGEVGRVKPIAFALAPAVGAALGVLVLGESLSVRKVLGIALLVLGVIVIASGSSTATHGAKLSP